MMRDTKVNQHTLESMLELKSLVDSVRSAGCPWDDKDACQLIADNFSDQGFDAFEIAALAKKLKEHQH